MKKIVLIVGALAFLSFGITLTKSEIKEFEKECEAGNFEACGAAGIFYEHPVELGGSASDRDYNKTLYYFKKACDRNLYAACLEIGAMYVREEGVKADYKKAMKLFNKACKGGEMEACSNLGFMYQYGKGVKVDKIRAIEYYKKACNAENWGGCGNLAVILEESGDKASAVQYYKKSCELGKNEEDLFNPEKNVLQRFCKRYEILKKLAD